MAKPRRKSWREKLADSKGLPKIEPIPPKMAKQCGVSAGTMLIPAPAEVDALMKQVPKGKLITTSELREALAAQHDATVCCPLTAGIFSWIAAHAAQEALDAGAKRVTPFWRTLKSGGELNPKYPGGVEFARSKLEAEGHTAIARGKRWFIADYAKRLHRLSAPDEV